MMSLQKAEKKSGEQDDDHTQPINLAAARAPAPPPSASGTTVATQPVAMRAHTEPPKPGLMTLYFRTPSTRAGQVGSVMANQVSSSQHFTSKQTQDFKNSISSWTVIRMPTSDITQAQVGASTQNTSVAMTPGMLPTALSGGGSRHVIPTAVHPVMATGGTAGPLASIIKTSHQNSQAGHIIHQPFSSHVPRGPAAVASMSAAPKSAVATPILRAPHSSTTMLPLASTSMMALHNPVRAKSPTLRTATPPVVATTTISQVVDLQKTSVCHSLSSNITPGVVSRPLESSVTRSVVSLSSCITTAKSNISQPIVQHLHQVYEKGTLKTVSSLAPSTNATNSTPAHQTVLPGSFSSVGEAVGVIPAVPRTGITQNYTGVVQLTAATAGQHATSLRAAHVSQAVHSLANVTTASVTPHPTFTVISTKPITPANHSITLAPPLNRAVTPTITASTPSPIVTCGTVLSGVASRPLHAVSQTAIPVAKVYPQPPVTTRSSADPPSSDVMRSGTFASQALPSRTEPLSALVSSSATTVQPVNTSDKQSTESAAPVRFTSLNKSQLANTSPYAASAATYLYHEQYPGGLTVHPYSASSSVQGFTNTQLRPLSFSQHATSNTAAQSAVSVASTPIQNMNSVVVAVDTRQQVALSTFGAVSTTKSAELTPTVVTSAVNSAATSMVTCVVSGSYNSLQSQANSSNHTSPRPSILRKRTNDGEKIKEAISATTSLADSKSHSATIIPAVLIKKDSGVTESPAVTSAETPVKDRIVEASPRKKPRKQLLAANELLESHTSDGDENNFNHDIKGKMIKEDIEFKADEEKPKSVSYYKRPAVSLLNGYRHSWKSRHNHFIRYTDVKPKEEKKPSVNELANQKGILQHANGWKIYHLTAQMDELVELEESIYSELSDLLSFVENDSTALPNKGNSDEIKIRGKLTDLIKGNLQRSKLVQEQTAESKQQVIKILDHKSNIIEIVNKYISRRQLKKKEKA